MLDGKRVSVGVMVGMLVGEAETVMVLVGIEVFSVDGPGRGVSLPPGFHFDGGFLVGLGVAV